MAKLIAILNVVAWSGFWTFGYLALSAQVGNTSDVLTALLLAAIGGGAGVFCWMWLVRYSEATAYAKARKRAYLTSHEEAA